MRKLKFPPKGGLVKLDKDSSLITKHISGKFFFNGN